MKPLDDEGTEVLEQCPSGKRRHPRERDAREVATHCRRRGARKLRVYRCNLCDGYHLTKQEPRSAGGDEE